jgi:signal recognition particle subunit SRP54
MFEALSDRLQGVFQRLKGKGKLSEADVTEAMREVRLALLEADVNFKVVKDFTARVKERAVGVEVLESLSPAQQVVKIVNEELIELLGGETTRLNIAAAPPTVIMLCGLQGAGKTTLAGKLGAHFKKQGRNPLMAACDIYRPAAVKQLQVLGSQIKVPVYAAEADSGKLPPVIARDALKHAAANGCDIVILDTAGRLAIDQELMQELKEMKAVLAKENASFPHEILLVVDAMVGQDAVKFAAEFNETLALTGLVMTKMDGDTRGGAALSIRAVTGVPIKFLGVGEKLDALEAFHPDRLSGRILGMGDILSLIEKAQEAIDEKEAVDLEKRLRESRFDLNDFLAQMEQMKKLGPLENLMKLLPGVNSQMIEEFQNVNAQKVMERKKAIVQSMTPKERTHPEMINGSRRKRIAAGCGQSVQEVNQFLNEFEQMRKMMRTMMNNAQGPKRKFPWGGRGNAPAAGQGQLPSGSEDGGLRKPGPKMPKGGRKRRFPFGG